MNPWKDGAIALSRHRANFASSISPFPTISNPLIPLQASSTSNIKELTLFWAHNNPKVQDILQMDFKIF